MSLFLCSAEDEGFINAAEPEAAVATAIGTIVPAAPGWRLMKLNGPLDEEDLDWEIVIAWGINPTWEGPTPITETGARICWATDTAEGLLAAPDGRFLILGDPFSNFDTLEAALNALRHQIKERAEIAARRHAERAAKKAAS